MNKALDSLLLAAMRFLRVVLLCSCTLVLEKRDLDFSQSSEICTKSNNEIKSLTQEAPPN